jgi:hypothetical protein
MQRFVIILCILLGLAVMVVAAATHRSPKAATNMAPPVNDLHKWHLRMDNSVQGSVADDSGAVRIDVAQSDMNNTWKMEYFHITSALKPNHKYKLSFDTKAATPFVFEVGAYSAYTAFFQPHGGAHPIGFHETVEAGPAWAHKEFTFTASDTDGHPDQAPTFTVGGMTGTVWIKNVILSEAS